MRGKRGQTHLHLVDVGRVVSLSTSRGNGLAAAVRNQPWLRLLGHDVHAVRPIRIVVAPAAFELQGEDEGDTAD